MGWDNIMYYLSILLHPKQNNAVGIESSILESVTTGVKGCIKKLFMRRVCTAYVSGKYQKLLAEALHFKGKMIVTKGVGIMNIVEKPPFIPVDKVQNFLYVGRLSPEKNLPYLVSVFNGLPDVKLNIIGFGPQEEELKRIAGKNITFYGAINNTDLPQYYRNNDVFILPSLSEPWGLVVEEALNNGLPVIISDRVGCRDEVVQDGVNGLIFSLQDADGLRKAVQKMQDVGFYNTLKKNAAAIDFNKIADEQVQCYCN
ncbi:hypothetical protein AGMMS4956_00580 [Bacteroidia bacterium]|nr:hypothetical protein AGMMS4956_00580 [Bacteroidia bacterium]